MNHSGHLHHSQFLPRVSDKGLPFKLEVVQSLREILAPLVQTVRLPEAKLGSFLMLLGKIPQCPALVAPSMPGGRLLVAGSGQGQAHWLVTMIMKPQQQCRPSLVSDQCAPAIVLLLLHLLFTTTQ